MNKSVWKVISENFKTGRQNTYYLEASSVVDLQQLLVIRFNESFIKSVISFERIGFLEK